MPALALILLQYYIAMQWCNPSTRFTRFVSYSMPPCRHLCLFPVLVHAPCQHFKCRSAFKTTANTTANDRCTNVIQCICLKYSNLQRRSDSHMAVPRLGSCKELVFVLEIGRLSAESSHHLPSSPCVNRCPCYRMRLLWIPRRGHNASTKLC